MSLRYLLIVNQNSLEKRLTTRVSHRFVNILVKWNTILWMLLLGVLNKKNQTGLWDAKLAECYSAYLPLWLGAQPRNPRFKPIWPGMIIEVLTICAKFLELSDYCIVNNCTITICGTTNVLGYWHDLIVLFKLVKLPNWTLLYVHLCVFQIRLTVRSNVQRAIASTYQPQWPTLYSLNCFDLVIYAPQTRK